ncbi:phytanoyl-CoA dioxygenase family protein [Pseudobdellovibrio exovorus]|uniref:Phytanoyl-CoA dioxygenase n=1 Tax=Pseudobdellovibrio exovorus JSS TaxID=1184267 RepID=M4VTS0_9BACT|nr:phytanoyl-CoA dioxygenase family protein [Pseudobdellovibrio exovorus]AGH96599.1 hypothetical protein A11Q_2383 [Pseudobdellovibrio exovorus JSS]
MSSASRLTAAELENYTQNGFLAVPRLLFSNDETEALKQRVIAVHQKVNPKFISLTGVHQYDPILLEWARRKEILDIVEQIIGPDIGLFSTTLFYKKAQTEADVDWHRDSEYLKAYNMFDNEIRLVSILVALTEDQPEQGCVEYIPASHLNPEMRDYRVEYGQKKMFVSDKGLADSLVNDEILSQRVPVPLHQGQFSLHDIHTLHGSEPNRSSQDRILLNFKYFPTSLKANREQVLQKHGIQQDLYLMRGRDLSGSCNL